MKFPLHQNLTQSPVFSLYCNKLQNLALRMLPLQNELHISFLPRVGETCLSKRQAICYIRILDCHLVSYIFRSVLLLVHIQKKKNNSQSSRISILIVYIELTEDLHCMKCIFIIRINNKM